MTITAKNNSKQSYLIFITVWIVLWMVPFFVHSSSKETLSDSNEDKISLDNRIILAWNQVAYNIANEQDQFYTFTGVRALAMMHIAMHDALNAVVPKYEHYAFKGISFEADPAAAVSQAAFAVLLNIYPNKADALKKELNKWLSQVQDADAKNFGIDLGKKSADAIIKMRSNDGYNTREDYIPGNKSGNYQYTPGFDWALAPGFRHAKSFGLISADQFRASPPPDLMSHEYSSAYNEVKTYGIKGSSARSQDQTNFAYWWAEFAEHSLNRIGRLTASERKLPLHETVRMFALINMTLYDIYLAIVDSKYFHDKWRPYTAIRMAASDGNPGTEQDTSWVPEMLTPPWPEYPSAHASCIAGGFEIFKHVYSTSNVTFTMESITALENNKVRSYNNLDSAADECADSRIMNGYHFRFSTEEGKKQGRHVADYIINNYLHPLE